MFKNHGLKKVLISTLVFVLLLSTVVVAANNIYEKKLTATHGRIKFKVDGKDVTKEIESKYGSPAFTVSEYGDRSYVPLRSIAELMGLEIKYDDATHTAELIDAKAEEHQAEITKKNVEISKLEREITKLEKQVELLKKDVVEEADLKSLEKKLNKEYGTYRDVEFDIELKESKDKITVSITVDFRDVRQQNNWNKMTHSYRKTLVENIVDDIQKEFKNVDISGSIYDDYYKRDLLTFSKKKNSSGVSISYRDSSSSGYRYDDILYDAEYYLDYYFKAISWVDEINIREDYNGDIYGTMYIEDDGNTTISEIRNAFYDAEDALKDYYGSGIYFDIELRLDGRYYGRYYNGEFRD